MNMKNSILVIGLTFIFGCNLSFAQINQKDPNGERHGVWKKYYSNKRVRYVGNFVHGKEVGSFKFYSAASSKFPTVVKIFNKNTNIAEVTFYKVDGKVESKGLMNGKNREGNWTYYHEDGKTIMSEEVYKNGKLHGSYRTFYSH